jgi:hypothetical protein
MCAWVVDFERWQLACSQNVVRAHLHMLGSPEPLDKGFRSLFSDPNTEEGERCVIVVLCHNLLPQTLDIGDCTIVRLLGLRHWTFLLLVTYPFP